MDQRKLLLGAVLLLIGVTFAFAQTDEQNRISPLAVSTMLYKDAYAKIIYSQPAKRGREVFGNLVPYGQVWRLGANEATEITLTKDMLIQEALLKAGTYSLFAIPRKDTWTIIVNKDLGMWGAYNYNPVRDEMRFEVNVNPTAGEVYERFIMRFEQRNEVADLLIFWDRVKVFIPMKFLN